MSTVVARRRSSSGFTLIEAAVATVVVGVGIVAALGLFAACTQQNRAASHATAAMMLAGNVQELMAELPFAEPKALVATFGAEPGETLETFDDVDDFNGASITPPVDALRRPLAELDRYTQAVTVAAVDPNTLAPTSAGGEAVRVTVNVLYAAPGETPGSVYELSWVLFRRK